MPDCDCSNACPPFIRSSFGVELLRIISHVKTFLYWSSFIKSTVENSPDSPSLQIKEWRSTARTGSGAPVSACNQRQSAILPETRDSSHSSIHLHPGAASPWPRRSTLTNCTNTKTRVWKQAEQTSPVKTDPLNSSSPCCTSRLFFFFAEWCCS